MANRIQRLSTERVYRLKMCHDKPPNQWPNPPCGRCAIPLSTWWGSGYTSVITEHSPSSREAREMRLNLCPSCYDALVRWLDEEI